ncbi:integrase catalytic domain-containing protein [Trichonephila inaurata madagascariensis]|uniref:Integrase catalytic domain-containing protein n=1 Tax=Trichonephila inaurata madagascariensis TaxID=2747483 RepID=A0A8X6XCT1_9ARAC|nr:integrase catalytic domain-containing protein [Trichonephila inaurata madagascariensis]
MRGWLTQMRKTIVITLAKTDDSDWYYRYFSPIRKIIRMLAWIFRFYFKLRKTNFDCSENLSVAELETPERFLREIPKSGVPDIDLVDKEKLSKRAKYIQSIRDQLRKQFRSEYLGQLRHQSVTNHQIKPLKVGEIVLLEDVNKKRTFWDLARAEKLIPGRDGQIKTCCY